MARLFSYALTLFVDFPGRTGCEYARRYLDALRGCWLIPLGCICGLGWFPPEQTDRPPVVAGFLLSGSDGPAFSYALTLAVDFPSRIGP